MGNGPVAHEYGSIHKTLHWIIFVLIAVQLIVGSAMPHIGNNTLDEGLVAWHFSIGATIMFFILVRLAWRLGRPVALAEMPAWQTRLANFTHTGLYILVLAMTVLGWAGVSYRGWTVKLFGIIPLPPLAAKGTPWAHTAGDIHNTLVYVLGAFIILHVAGALYHYLVLRDRVLQRMLPGV